MKELMIACAVAAIFVFGYFIMKKLDAFLAANRRCIDNDKEMPENSLLLAFDNPMILDALSPLFEEFSKANPNCRLHFLFGNTEDIYDKLNKNSIDFAFIKYTAANNETAYHHLIISPKQDSFFCDNIGHPIEPLNPAEIQTAVIWKKASNNALAESFGDLLSNQIAISA